MQPSEVEDTSGLGNQHSERRFAPGKQKQLFQVSKGGKAGSQEWQVVFHNDKEQPADTPGGFVSAWNDEQRVNVFC